MSWVSCPEHAGQFTGFLLAGLMLASAIQASAATEINFKAEAPKFEAAAEEYRMIWKQDGERIAATLHGLTGLHLEPGPIQTVVFEGVSNSGYRDIPMRMRASLPADTKRATLVHELGHRLISRLVPKDFEEHPVIFLFVYDAWVELGARNLPTRRSRLRAGAVDDTTTQAHGKTRWHSARPGAPRPGRSSARLTRGKSRRRSSGIFRSLLA